MNDQFSLIPSSIEQKLAVTEIIRCNNITSKYGLSLSKTDAAALAKTKNEVLEKVGRVEFAGGAVGKLILEFCDSPYLSQFNYAETLNELLEIFYYFKNETLDELDDDELIAFMKKSFDETCQGSIDLLQTREMENLARNIRFNNTDMSHLNEDSEVGFEQDLDVNNISEDEFGEDEFDLSKNYLGRDCNE